MLRRFTTALLLPLALGCLIARAQSRPAAPLLAYAAASDGGCYSSSCSDPTSDSTSSSTYLAPRPKEIELPPLVGRRKPLEYRRFQFLSAVAVGVKADSFGYGVEVATPVAPSMNLRVGGNLFNYGYTFGVDGVNYNAQILFHSGQVNLDWYPFHGSFHVGPAAIYFNNQVNALLNVPAGKSFELGNSAFTNSISDPVHGSAAITYGRSIAPALVAGFGNILPRSGRHFSVPVEFGAAYTGVAQIKLKLQGTACQSGACFNMATNPDYQYSLLQQQNDMNETLKKFQVYPIVSTGISYRF